MNKPFVKIAYAVFSVGYLLILLSCIGCEKNKTENKGPEEYVHNPIATINGTIQIWMKNGTEITSDTGEFPIDPDSVRWPFYYLRVRSPDGTWMDQPTGIICIVGSTDLRTNIPIYPPVKPYQCNAMSTQNSKQLGVEGANCGGFYNGGSISIAIINLSERSQSTDISLAALASHVLAHEAGHGFITEHMEDDPGTAEKENLGNVMAPSIDVNETLISRGYRPRFSQCQMAIIKNKLGL